MSIHCQLGAPATHPVVRRRRFTLVEILAVLGIFTLAAVAVATSAAGGLRIYQRSLYFSGLQTDLLLAFERLEGELRSTFNFDNIGFEGDQRRLAFPALVQQWQADNLLFARFPGRVAYHLDPGTGTWLRTSQSYAQATAPDAGRRGDETVLASGLDSLEFSYCRHDPETEQYSWQSSWNREDGLPVAVAFVARVADPGGGLATFERTILIPVALPAWQSPALPVE